MNSALFRLKLLLIAIAALFSFCASAQQYYRWIDENGVSHFSQNPPPEQASAEVGLLPQNALVNDQHLQQAPEEDGLSNSEESLASFGKDPELCTQILQSLQTMNEHENIVMTDPETGNGIYLSESERAAEQVRLEDMRRYYCE